MTIFKAIRLAVWSTIFAAAIATAGIYLAVAQTLLTTDGLNKIITESQAANTIRTDTILPKVLQGTQSSEYVTLLDDKTVTAAVNETFTTDKITSKLEPAVTSFHNWLDSKEPSITFSISTTDLTDEFARTLSQKVVEKYKAAPTCTFQNTRAEALAGECRSQFVTDESLASTIQQIIKSDASIKEITTITPDSLAVPTTIKSIADDLPTYLNMFYALSIIAAGIAVLVGAWLLLKHRLNGFVALGGGALLAGVTLLVATGAGIRRLEAISDDAQTQQVIRAMTTMLSTHIRTEVLILVGSGVVLIIIGIVGKILMRRYAGSHQSLHLSSEDNKD
ncbi:hypothetical protein A2707_04650 [Candidatus Saccharibacteria bacterium RIFCSPHIGHO2_01_FULL_45_15]|nr:MAG: hypothetical protein A2707_04650 [Candidatus Saccharibacteria bacterium RIFCSPHIGHO2_01_FULL_45_15]OGL27531.1 MAG: hypothetical protein A3C39_03155 [Candidatus Saccharibacteria bacterium RIFCSPHIGHO2_02_FULL_46_12]OGL32736.1 MAG: hypothetical protein A3E76_05310 [Candidatus Saccharibacteria bacterium RIFCSPHIGHO2_12_FULL_44_22]